MNPKKSEPAFTRENLLRAAAARLHEKFVSTRSNRADIVPDGWFNADELAKAMKMSSSSVRRNMRRIDAPKKTFNLWIGNTYRQINHWKP